MEALREMVALRHSDNPGLHYRLLTLCPGAY